MARERFVVTVTYRRFNQAVTGAYFTLVGMLIGLMLAGLILIVKGQPLLASDVVFPGISILGGLVFAGCVFMLGFVKTVSENKPQTP